jgi:nucleotide-binding universal stress UspA family protein
MVRLELGRSNAGLLAIAGDLAEQFHSSMIGIAGSQVEIASYNDGNATGEIIVEARDDSKRETKEAEAEFRGALKAKTGSIDWRSTVMSPSLSEYIAAKARSADLVISTANIGDIPNTSRLNKTGELLMQVGRPVLIVPGNATKLNLDSIVVAWNDTREARRAAFDALPLLTKAAHVTVVELTEKEGLPSAQSHVKDVGGWLKQHGVVAECMALLSTGDEETQLNDIAHEQGADIVVASAYGHGRLHEFVFGGVTRDLLKCQNHYSLMSH